MGDNLPLRSTTDTVMLVQAPHCEFIYCIYISQRRRIKKGAPPAPRPPFSDTIPQEEKWQITGLLRQLSGWSVFLIDLQCPVSAAALAWPANRGLCVCLLGEEGGGEAAVMTAVVFTCEVFTKRIRRSERTPPDAKSLWRSNRSDIRVTESLACSECSRGHSSRRTEVVFRANQASQRLALGYCGAVCVFICAECNLYKQILHMNAIQRFQHRKLSAFCLWSEKYKRR